MRVLLGMASGHVGLDRVVEFVHHQVPLEVAYVAELRDGRQIYRAVAGDGASFGIALDEARRAEGTYSQALAAGEIPNMIGDVSADQRAAGLLMSRDARVGAFVGVLLKRSDGTIYGTLGCLAHQPCPSVDERDERLLWAAAELLVDDLDELGREDELREQVFRVIDTAAVGIACQPVFDLRGGACIGLEALARFPTTQQGPDEMFAAAEKVGLGLELERLAISTAWKLLPRLGAGQFLALNASPSSLLELSRRANRRVALPLRKLVVEVTEHAEIDSYSDLRAELAPLRARGLRLAVDDAGAGYASLRHVLELRPDFIKLDRWLIHGLANDPARRAAAGAFVSLARDLGSKVIGEGVERPTDLSAARELGVDAAQGYLLGRPSLEDHVISGWCSPTTSAPVSSPKRRAALRRGAGRPARTPALTRQPA